MSDPRDEIDSWLDREVDLLPPPPGTFTAIRARAGRRKRNQALLTTAAAVVVVAGAVTVPTVLRSALSSGPPAQPAASHTSTITQSPSSSPAKTSTPKPHGTAGSSGPRSTLVNSTTGPPAKFRPTSVTFVASGGKLLGAAIGQAGPPCAGGTICTSMASTPDYGLTWYGFSAPPAPSAAKPGGVSQVRFITPYVGWAFGPGFYGTLNSGKSWNKEQIPGGGRVIDLEGEGNEALALVGSCTGAGIDYAANCTSFSLYSYDATAPSQGWQQVSLPVGLTGGGQPSAARLVIGGSTAYLLTPGGQLLAGQLSGHGWRVLTTAPCEPDAPLADGEPSGALLAAGTDAAGAGYVFVYCPGGSPGQGAVSELAAHGSRWHSFGTVPVGSGQPTSLAGAQNVTVLATSTGIFYAAGTGHWQAAQATVPAGGFSYIGMTNSRQGVAIPADVRLSEIFTTGDGGKTWQARQIG